MKISHVVLSSLVVTALSFSVSMMGQEAAGTISGSVADSSGGSIPEATIQARKTDTNAVREAKSNDRGQFTIPSLQPGVYSLTVTRDGFKKGIINAVELQVNQVVTVNAVLELGAVTESINVEAAVSALQLENTTVGAVIETRKINELPLNGRQFLQLTTLIPGTISGYTRDASRQGGRRANVNIAVSGNRSEFNNYLLDGVLNTDENFGTYIVSPSVDALLEFKLQTSSYSAQYGRGGAGQINIITKSGTNQFHGTVFEFLRNAKLDAKNFFDRGDLPIPPFKQNQFGLTFGGPIWIPKIYNGTNKTFFFFNYEGFRIRQAGTSVSTVPLAAWRTGDLSGVSTAIFDPTTVRPDPVRQGSFIRDPFPGNRIPSGRLDPTSQYLLTFLPLPNLPGTANNYLSNEGTKTDDDQFTGRLDHNFSPNDMLFGRYSLSDENTFAPGAFPGMGTLVQVGGQVLGVGETHVFGPGTVNEFRFGFNRLRNALLQQNAYSNNVVATAGIRGLSSDPIDFGIPSISVQGLTGWGDQGFAYPSLLRDNVFQYSDNLSLVRGRHSLNVGFEFRRFQYANFANNLTRGSYNFRSPLFTANPASPTNTGLGLGDYLLGLPNFAEGSVGDTSIYDRRSSYNAYVQDDIRLTKTFTLNLGARYEYNPYPVEKYDRIETLDFSTRIPTIVRAGTGDPFEMYPRNIRLDPSIPFVRDGRFGRSLLKSDKNDLAPRIGFSWAVTPKLAIRSAYGIFFSQDIGNPFFDLARNVPRNVRAALSSDPITPQLDMTTLFLGLSSGQSVLAPTLTMTDPNYKTTYIQQWSFNVQREFSSSLVLEAGYVANKGTNLGLLNLTNLAPAGPGAPQPRRPFPMYERIFFIQHILNSSYNSFQLKLEKRFTHGLSFLTSYTYGKSLDYASSTRTSGEGNRPIDPSNLRLERGRSLFDARQNFVFSALYELPFGPGKAFLTRGGVIGHIFGEWQLSGIYQARTGLPFTVGASGDIANTGNDASGRANYVGGQEPSFPRSERGPNRWFNTAAFATPAPYTFGNAGRNTLDAPGLANVDISAIKNFRVAETTTIQFRGEFFNATNTPRFGTPSRTVNGAAFGRISSAGPARQIQFGLKVIF